MFAARIESSQAVAAPEGRVFTFMPYGAVKFRNDVACMDTGRVAAFVFVAENLVPPPEGQFDTPFVFLERNAPAELFFAALHKPLQVEPETGPAAGIEHLDGFFIDCFGHALSV